MDNEAIIRQFAQIEEKVERLLEAQRSLKATNSELNRKIETLEGDLQSKVAVESSYIKERDLIRSKVDSLLEKLEGVSEPQP